MPQNENPQHTQVVKAAMQQMTQNQGPGQAKGNKQGFTKVNIANPKAQNPIHKPSN